MSWFRMQKEYLVKKTLFVILLATLLISCLVGGMGGPQSSPKSVVRAFTEASVTKDCERVASLVSPDRRDEYRVVHLCGGFASANIDHILVRNGNGAMIGKKMVTLVGSFELAITDWDNVIKRETYLIVAEELNGKWYIFKP